jgi:hypothetical protein
MNSFAFVPQALDPTKLLGPNWYDRDRRDPAVRQLEREGLEALLRAREIRQPALDE